MMQLKMFADLQLNHDLPLLPSWCRSLVIDREKFKNITPGSLIYISFDLRTNVIRGPGIEIEVLKTSTFPQLCPPSVNLNIQEVQFVHQPYPKTYVIFSYNSIFKIKIYL